MNIHVYMWSLTAVGKELHFIHGKTEDTSRFVHKDFCCVEVESKVDVSVSRWLCTRWHCSNFFIAYFWCIPDVKVIWYSIESQSGKTSYTVTVVVQCDGSQVDSCWEYEQ